MYINFARLEDSASLVHRLIHQEFGTARQLGFTLLRQDAIDADLENAMCEPFYKPTCFMGLPTSDTLDRYANFYFLGAYNR